MEWRRLGSGRPRAGCTAPSPGRSFSPAAQVHGGRPGVPVPPARCTGLCRVTAPHMSWSLLSPLDPGTQGRGRVFLTPDTALRLRKPASPPRYCESERSGRAWSHVSRTAHLDGSSGASLGHGARGERRARPGGAALHTCAAAMPDAGGRWRPGHVVPGVCVGHRTGRAWPLAVLLTAGRDPQPSSLCP